MKLVTKYQISAINSCCEKCDEKLSNMFNVYKKQLSRQTGSRNLTGPKTFPVTSVLPSKIFFVAFFSVTVDGRNLIFGHKLHIGTPYRGKHFWTHQIPTSCLLTLLIYGSKNATHNMVYLYDACDQISDFCHQQLLRKMRRKISWTEGQR
jgi:hypothetical protein